MAQVGEEKSLNKLNSPVDNDNTKQVDSMVPTRPNKHAWVAENLEELVSATYKRKTNVSHDSYILCNNKFRFLFNFKSHHIT